MPPIITVGWTYRSKPVAQSATYVGRPFVVVLKGPICHMLAFNMAPSPIPTRTNPPMRGAA
jgi:hypothetical protein